MTVTTFLFIIFITNNYYADQLPNSWFGQKTFASDINSDVTSNNNKAETFLINGNTEENIDNKDHSKIKSMSDSVVKSGKLIDEQYNEIKLEKFASVELRYINGYWYVMSSDGLKNS